MALYLDFLSIGASFLMYGDKCQGGFFWASIEGNIMYLEVENITEDLLCFCWVES
jgi:hypothetical protein